MKNLLSPKKYFVKSTFSIRYLVKLLLSRNFVNNVWEWIPVTYVKATFLQKKRNYSYIFPLYHGNFSHQSIFTWNQFFEFCSKSTLMIFILCKGWNVLKIEENSTYDVHNSRSILDVPLHGQAYLNLLWTFHTFHRILTTSRTPRRNAMYVNFSIEDGEPIVLNLLRQQWYLFHTIQSRIGTPDPSNIFCHRTDESLFTVILESL